MKMIENGKYPTLTMLAEELVLDSSNMVKSLNLPENPEDDRRGQSACWHDAEAVFRRDADGVGEAEKILTRRTTFDHETRYY